MFNALNYVCAFFKPIVPLVYDNTMTLYETVGKLLHKVNEMITAYNKVLPELQNVDQTTEAAKKAAEYVLEAEKLPHVVKRKTFMQTSGDVTYYQYNTLYSDGIQEIDITGVIDADVTAGSTFTLTSTDLFNSLTGDTGGFTTKLYENVFFVDRGSTYGGNGIAGLATGLRVKQEAVKPVDQTPEVEVTFSSTVNHIKGNVYIHAAMKAGE